MPKCRLTSYFVAFGDGPCYSSAKESARGIQTAGSPRVALCRSGNESANEEGSEGAQHSCGHECCLGDIGAGERDDRGQGAHYEEADTESGEEIMEYRLRMRCDAS